MPILASLGTANDRAFGFGDSSFASGYDLPAIITNNAEIIYDASNPNSVVTEGFDVGLAESIKETFFNWKFAILKSTPVSINDEFGIAEFAGQPVTPNSFHPIIAITAHPTDTELKIIEVDYSGLGYVGITKGRIEPGTNSLKTWYDISGNNRHATFNTAPTIIGANNNQAILLPDTGAVTLTIPQVYTAYCAITYVMLIKIPGGNLDKVFDGRGWKSTSYGGYFFFAADLEGSGGFGDTTYNSPISSSVLSGYAMVYSNITLSGSSTSANTWLNNDAGYVEHATSSFSNYGGNSGALVGKAGVNVEIKMIAMYQQSNAPTQLQAYNALKGRFGL